MKNACCQNILINTCKNEPGKPVFIRVSRGYCRNEISPLRALTPFFMPLHSATHDSSRNEISPLRALTQHIYFGLKWKLFRVEMKSARLGHWHHSRASSASYVQLCRNEISPLRALTLVWTMGFFHIYHFCRNEISPFRISISIFLHIYLDLASTSLERISHETVCCSNDR